MHRDMSFEMQGAKKTISNSLGFPQGGVASAKLWILAFNEAMEIINSDGIFGVGFADDCCSMIGGKNLHHMMSRMQKMINELTDWGKEVGLTFNPDKTVVIIFTKANLKDDKKTQHVTHGRQTNTL